MVGYRNETETLHVAELAIRRLRESCSVAPALRRKDEDRVGRRAYSGTEYLSHGFAKFLT